MKENFKSLQDNETWEFVPLPSKRKLVQCKWVYRNTMVYYGSDIKYKDSLVSKGFSQFQGVYYTEKFTPVSKLDSIRLVLSIATSKRWEVHHMDVKSDFLHGELHKEIYMQHPEGFLWSLTCI